MLNNTNRNDVDDEWDKFISSYNNDSDESCEEAIPLETNINIALKNHINHCNDIQSPKSGEIYISTKSKIAYLDKAIDLNPVFGKYRYCLTRRLLMA